MLCTIHYSKLIAILRNLELEPLLKNSDLRKVGDCLVCEGRMSMRTVLDFALEGEPVSHG